MAAALYTFATFFLVFGVTPTRLPLVEAFAFRKTAVLVAQGRDSGQRDSTTNLQHG
jgi:hypothetical protein